MVKHDLKSRDVVVLIILTRVGYAILSTNCKNHGKSLLQDLNYLIFGKLRNNECRYLCYELIVNKQSVFIKGAPWKNLNYSASSKYY